MSSLAEFLKKQERQPSGSREDVIRKRTAWCQAVDGLIQRLSDQLKAADDEGVLQIHRVPYSLREQGIGFYTIDGLIIALGDRYVEVIPVGRNVATTFDEGTTPSRYAEGRIDLTNGTEKYRLYRFVVDGKDEWWLMNDWAYRIRRFDEAAFEEVMQRLLA